MKQTVHRFKVGAVAAALSLALPASASADEAYDALKAQVEMLTKQLQEVQKTLKQYQKTTVSKEEVAAIKEEARAAKATASAASSAASAAKAEASAAKSNASVAAEWLNPNTLLHMSGYADVGFTDVEGGDDSFNVGTFAPIFHFQYRDLVMLESELEIEVEPDGETEVGLEYMTIDLFLKDYLAVVAGKFLSPIGQFRQNLHPSWINKLPSAPVGFGHDGAAPLAEIGVMARGGFALGGAGAEPADAPSGGFDKSFKPAVVEEEPRSTGRRAKYVNYAVYVGNGPELHSVIEDGEIELEGIETEGFGRDIDGNKIVGGRIGILPVRKLEIGASVAMGDARVISLEDEETGATTSLTGEANRDYNVYGFDFAWQHKKLNVRGEWVKSEVGAASTGATASPGATWETWYIQGSRQIASTKFEGVVRYTDFDSPHDSEDQTQTAVGLNYLFSPSTIGKIAYEFNDGRMGSATNDDRWLAQLAYGF